MKVLSLFTGIGAFEKALTNIGIDYELVGFSEIDKYAIKSYCAIHNVNESLNLGDITKIEKEKLPRFIDLITHGSPCQDFSVAGLQAGGDIGSKTRSSLMWNTVDIVEWCLPKYVIWENVKNLLSKKHRHNFDSYIEIMDKLGYNSYYQVLNAKDYGIPQNRERVYTISIRKDIDKGNFKFPEKEELKLRLKDMLENEVKGKYYLNDERVKKIINSNFMQEKKRVQEKDVCDTLLARDWKDPKCIRIGGIFDTDKSKHQAGSIYDKEGLSPTLDVAQGGWRQPSILEDGFVEKKYNEFIEEKGYVPEMFNPYNKSEIKDIAPTQSTQCGSMTSSATVMVLGNYMPSNHDASRIVSNKGLTPTVKENHGTVTAVVTKNKRLNSLINKTNFEEGKVLNMDLYNQTTNENISQCLTEPHHNTQRLFDGYRIRKLTPKECWRLMRI